LIEDSFRCHSDKQEQLIFSDNKITAAITGIQWAKTTSGAWWMKRKMFEYTSSDDNFLVTAPTYKILKQSTLPAFLKVMTGFGEMKYGDMEFHLYGGGKCYFRTGTEPDSVVGITNVRAVWGDEAGKYSLYFWENLQGRASFKNAPIMLTSTPYAMNWFYKEILKPYKEGKSQDILVIQAKSSDNPYFSVEEYERRKLTMDPRRFNAMYNGEFEKMHGLVYDCFDEATQIIEPIALPQGTKFYGGVDWGYTHPFVIVVRAITPAGEHYQVSEFYKAGLTVSDMIQVAQKFKSVWDIQVFYCDPAQPGHIEEFNRNKCSALPARNDIRKGIDLHYTAIKEHKYKIFKDSSPHTIDEYNSYHYGEPKDLGPDDKDKEQLPVDQDNHAMDANRYVTIETFHTHPKKAPQVPNQEREENNEQRIRRLKRGKSDRKRTEIWTFTKEVA
jgi:PBSX family phage terminase large subunit